MGRFDKHINIGEPVDLEGEKVSLKPLDVEYLPHFFKAMKSFSGASDKKSSVEDVLKNISDEGLNSVKIIIAETLKRSLPEETEEVRGVLGLKFMGILLTKIFEINSTKPEEDDKVGKMIKHVTNQ